jgi:hypothetical protein
VSKFLVLDAEIILRLFIYTIIVHVGSFTSMW